MTPPRAPPPGGGCCRSSQPESLGEGEEAAAPGHLPPRRGGRAGAPSLSPLRGASAAARESRMSSLGKRKWLEPSRLPVNPRVGKRPANSWPLKPPGKAPLLPVG